MTQEPVNQKPTETTIIFFANTEWYLYNFRSALIGAVRDAGWSVRCVSPPGPYGEKLREAGFQWQALPFARDSRLGMLRSLRRTRGALRRLIRQDRPAVIHSFTLTSILLAWLACPSKLGIRRVNAVTGLGYAFTGTSLVHRLLRGVLRPFIRRALAGDDAWTVVQNETDRAFLIEMFGLDRDRVRLIQGSGVDVGLFRPASDGEPGTLRVGFVGRMLGDKGIREFVAAASRLRETHPKVEFFAAGAPDLGNPAAIDAAELQAWQNAGEISFPGQVEDMPGFLNSLDIFVLPSYREGLSRSLIEAGACGLPAVTTDVPGCRDVVLDGDNGLLVPARDADALGAAIRRLVENAELRKRMALRARDVVVGGFSNEVVNAKTLELYQEVLAD